MSSTAEKDKERQKLEYEEFDWVNIQTLQPVEMPDLKEKLQRNPLVIVGLLATTGILAGGIRQMIKRNAIQSQYYMRARIVSQALTLCALVGGTIVAAYKE